MSLYGLDILVGKEKNHLIEINGVCSGMRGFVEVYGDNRVQEKVASMLENEYGKITMTDGSYSEKNWVSRKLNQIRSNFKPRIVSEKAHTDWQFEKVASKRTIFDYPFEIYNGQESTILNLVNIRTKHPSVNPYITEEITRNKFLQYLLLKDSDISHLLPQSTLVGLGATDRKDLSELLETAESFIVKPIMGSVGRGVQKLTKEEAEDFRYESGAVRNPSFMESLVALGTDISMIEYIEDFIDNEDFSFEYSVSILQPFIEPRGDEYGVVRAIVCNGEFVDAYERVDSDFRVNLSRGAEAVPFEKDGFSEVCEHIVNVFETECDIYSDNFRKELYTAYIEKRGRRTEMQRQIDAGSGVMSSVTSSITSMMTMR